MDFSWTEHQKDLKKTATVFAREKLNVDLIAREREGRFPAEDWKRCAEFGVQGLLVPLELGGMGGDLFDAIAVMEGIGYGCRDNGLLTALNAHILGCGLTILHSGTDSQKRKYLPGMCEGRLIGAHAMSEPEAGSDVFALRTSAVRDGDCYVLNGSKTFVTNAPIADVFTVYARTGKGKGLTGLSCFLVDKGTPGLAVGRNFDKMGLRTGPMSDVTFQDCRVPTSSLVGDAGSGSFIFTDSMEWERTFVMAFAIGSMERQLDSCIRHKDRRVTGGKRIGEHQSVGNTIAAMKMRLEAGRLMLYKAVWLKKNGPSAFIESAAAKVTLSETYVQNSRDAIQVHGAYGYMVETELERELRDALAGTLYSGTTEVLTDSIARLLIPSMP